MSEIPSAGPLPAAVAAPASETPADSASRFEVFSYDDQIVRWFVIATSIWGFVGMLVGALLAL